jgi:ceramide glucosyltransferase
MTTITTLLLAAAAFGTCFYAMGIVSALLHLRRRNRIEVLDSLPPISLLKPVKGLEEDLEGCLRSFFEQDYPGELELVFASAQRDDAALRVARRLAKQYPNVRTRFVQSDENWGLNPKVSNLEGAVRAARHDLVLQTDANVWAPRDYVRTIVSELISEKASLLSSMVSGIGERSPAAAMENLQLTSYVAPGCCAALKVAGITCVIGKSMLFRKSELRALGGLELVKDYLGEDFLLGRHYEEGGKKVLLSATPIKNLNRDTNIERFLARHTRWLKMRAVIHVPGFICDFFANPVAVATLAWLSSGFDDAAGLVLAAIVLGKLCLDGLIVRAIRGEAMALRHLVWSPVKDLLMLGVWCYAVFSRSVEWRGIRFRMGADSQILPDEGPLPVRVMRRLFA